MPHTAAEIMEVLARGRNPSSGEYAIRNLQRDWERSQEAAKPFMDFIPIRLVTIIETSVREAVVRAVDHGEPYTSRGLSLIAKSPAKAVGDTLLAIKKQRITLGHLASFGFPVGRMDEIIGALTTIFGERFSDELAAARTQWSEDEDRDLSPIITNFPGTIGCLDRLFRTRHILVHEQPRERPYVEEEIAGLFLHSAQFVAALKWMLIGRLYGRVPRTQLGMNMQAGQETKEAQAELAALRSGTVEDFADPKPPLAELEHHWDRYCELSAQLRAGYLS